MSSGSWLPVFLLVFLAILVVAGMIALPYLVAPRRKSSVKQMPYESGMDPVGDARGRFDVRFYLVAIVFLLFDVELLFLYPWAVAAYHDAGFAAADRTADLPGAGFIFCEILLFIALLALAYGYAWRRGVFDWK